MSQPVVDRRGFLKTSGAAAAAAGSSTAGARYGTISRLSIQPLRTDRLDTDKLPAALVDYEKRLLGRGIDLPVILLRSKDYPGAVWTLRLPEQGFLGHEGRTGYQVKYRWKQNGPDEYTYDWHPITGSRLARAHCRGKSAVTSSQRHFACGIRGAVQERIEQVLGHAHGMDLSHPQVCRAG